MMSMIFDQLRFIADHAGMALVDAISEAYRQGQQDAQPEIVQCKDCTITPERKRGRWEIYIISMIDGEGCRCSECGFEGAPYWEFCPNCGSYNGGEQHE